METKNWYDKSHKLMLLLPIIVLIASIAYLANMQIKTGDIIYKDVSLTGGTSVTIFDENIDVNDLKEKISTEFPDISVKTISDFRTGKQTGVIIETTADYETIRPGIESFLGYELTQDNSSTEFSGSTISQGFYLQLRMAIVAAFLLMAWVVFYVFGESKRIKGLTLMLTSLGIGLALPEWKAMLGAVVIIGLVVALFDKNKNKKQDYLIIFATAIICFIILFYFLFAVLLLPVGIVLLLFYYKYSVPSLAIILCAFGDIIMTIAVVDLLGIKLSTAGIIAFLMLIGYSVDSDILLTTRVLKRSEDSVNHRVYGAFKTGLTMTLTSLAAVGISLLVTYKSSVVLGQIFTIVLIGLFLDIFNTWVTNASIIKWYAERKEFKK
jgi:preprotein translocase subunit SecF